MATGSWSIRRATKANTSIDGPVEPLHVLDDEDDRVPTGVVAQQGEERQRHEVGIAHLLVGEAERGTDGIALRRRELIGRADDRSQELVQAGEGHLGLGLDGRRSEHRAPVELGAVGHRRQQRRLPDARVADHRTGAAAFA